MLVTEHKNGGDLSNLKQHHMAISRQLLMQLQNYPAVQTPALRGVSAST